MVPRHIRIAAAILLVVIAVPACNGSSATGTGSPTAGAGSSAASTSPSASPSGLPAGAVVLDFPANQAQARQCEIFKGRSNLAADKTLVLGLRNMDNNDPQRYFEAVSDWEYPDSIANWSGPQWFGSGDTSVGQRFRVEVLVLARGQVAQFLTASKRNGWHSADNPPGATVGAHVTLHRVKGPGPQECS